MNWYDFLLRNRGEVIERTAEHIELVAAARAIDLRSPLRPSPANAAAVAELRKTVPGPAADRYLAPDLAAADELLHEGRLADAVAAVVGELR